MSAVELSVGSRHTWIASDPPPAWCQTFSSAPVSPSNPGPLGYSSPSMQSNERFSEHQDDNVTNGHAISNAWEEYQCRQ